MKQARIERIETYLRQKTAAVIEARDFSHIDLDAFSIALDLKLDRTNVSKDLNSLWKNGKLLKIHGRPVYYLHYQVLSDYYPDKYFPSVISKDESLHDYLSESTSSLPKEIFEHDPLSELIGSDGSLSEQIIKAKSALTYPPKGLHTFILGEEGTGKSLFATRMYKYTMAKKIKGEECPLLTVYCRDFINSPQLFQEQLLGVSRLIGSFDRLKKGLLETSKNGILIFEDIDYLSNASLNLLCAIIAQNSYSKIGETSTTELSTIFIATSRHQAEDRLVEDMLNYFPTLIELPSIDQRGLFEKLELIFHLFALEAIETKSRMRISKDIIVCFASMPYEKNITQLKNEIKIACSKAYLDFSENHSNTVTITYNHLSNKLLASSSNLSIAKTRIISLLKSIPEDDILYDETGYSKEIEFFKATPELYSTVRLNQFVKEFNIDVNELENMDEYVSENISCLISCAEPQLRALKRNINPTVYQTFLKMLAANGEYVGLLQNIQLLYGILLHISNLIKRIDEGNNKEVTERTSVMKSVYQNEFRFAKELYEEILFPYHYQVSEQEIDFLTSYLIIAKQWATNAKIAILVICHGKHVASEMVQYIKESFSEPCAIEAIDFEEGMQLNDCLELACIKAVAINQGAGVLVACDLPPLTSVSGYIYQNTKIPSRSLSNISLSDLIELVGQTMKSVNDLDTLLSCTVSHSSSLTNKENQITTQNSFMQNLASRVIAKTVVFLDVPKTLELLKVCLQDTLHDLMIPYSNELAVKYYCHTVNMVERVIRNETWNYSHLNTFINENASLVHVVEKNLKLLYDSYQITAPASEIAYLTEIFKFHQL